MSQIEIILPDNSIKAFDHEPSTLEVAKSIGARLADATLGAYVNGEVIDLRQPLKSGTRLEIITDKHALANEVIRHSAAHIMAQAVQELWPQVKVTIGPVIDSGFYYDFDSEKPFTPEDLEKIEKQMEEIIKRDIPILREEWKSSQAIDVFGKMGENFKVEIIEDLKTPVVSIYKQGEWFDLCRGPHVQRTGQVKAVKVLALAGAYWRGDEKNKQLQRVYATAFGNKKDLEKHLQLLEEAQKRDHRRLGKDLGLFHFHQWSPGAPFFTGKGSVIYNQLQKFIREKYLEYGYEEVITPQIFDVELYRTSGHEAHYKENMYYTHIDERDFSMKPMNCPGHCLLYGMSHRSYRDLPWRVADFGRLHRFERSGVMHGLTRVRSFCQDDAHIFCSLDQLQQEISNFMKMLKEVYATLGMDQFEVFLSTRPESRLGSDEVWDQSEGALAGALESMGIPYKINPGDGAFYGPKIDINFKDAIERKWQLGTLQVDFNNPERFKLKYIGDDNQEHRPVMLHRAILGSLERFIGVYIEHCAGRFPTWLSPVQVKIINVSEKQGAYSLGLEKILKENGIRVEYDSRNEKLGYKIREAQLMKIPYMIIVGDKEMEAQKVSLRLRNGQNKEAMELNDFLKVVLEEINERKLESPFLSE